MLLWLARFITTINATQLGLIYRKSFQYNKATMLHLTHRDSLWFNSIRHLGAPG